MEAFLNAALRRTILCCLGVYSTVGWESLLTKVVRLLLRLEEGKGWAGVLGPGPMIRGE